MKSCNRSARTTCAYISIFVALAVSLPASAQGKDDLWEISTKMEMPGMPMAMPGQVSRVCVGKNRKDEDLVPKQGDCHMVGSKRVGNKFTYAMDCTGSEPSTVAGEITFGNNAYDGKMHMTMQRTKDTMDMTYVGKRVGDCTAPAK